jgi:hypothetical protein
VGESVAEAGGEAEGLAVRDGDQELVAVIETVGVTLGVGEAVKDQVEVGEEV